MCADAFKLHWADYVSDREQHWIDLIDCIHCIVPKYWHRHIFGCYYFAQSDRDWCIYFKGNADTFAINECFKDAALSEKLPLILAESGTKMAWIKKNFGAIAKEVLGCASREGDKS
jgi:hypothetical protein